jgi:hypothetical protein
MQAGIAAKGSGSVAPFALNEMGVQDRFKVRNRLVSNRKSTQICLNTFVVEPFSDPLLQPSR